MIYKNIDNEDLSKGLNNFIMADLNNLEHLVNTKAPIEKVLSVMNNFDFYFSRGESLLHPEDFKEYKEKFKMLLKEYSAHLVGP